MLRAAALLVLAAALRCTGGPVVDLPGVGAVEGVAEYGGVSYKGIPYAAAPVGALRWMPPAPHAGWNGTRRAAEFGASCMLAGPGCGRESEDCLFLNVYTPADPPASPLPVMVWIHGGAYEVGCGSTSQRRHDPSRPVVFVTVNYRLNVFGFLGAPDVATEEGGTGNYGIQDQRAAMQWVRANIAAFGGDSRNVLIHGESAGGNSQIQHLVQPSSFPFYDKVIIQSGTYHATKTLAAAKNAYDDLLCKLNCSDVACARSAAPVVLLAAVLPPMAGQMAFGHFAFGPVIDGVNLHDEPWRLFEQKKHNTKVPVVLGSVRDESSFFLQLEAPVGNSTVLEEAEFDRAAQSAAPGNAAAVKEVYRFNGSYPYPASLGSYNMWWWMTMRLTTDGHPHRDGDPHTPGGSYLGLGHCTARKTARALASANPNVWLYLFAYPSPDKGSILVPHASELAFNMNCASTDSNDTDCEFENPRSAVVAESMYGYWYSFAKTSDPGGSGAVRWPAYTEEGDQVLRFGVPTAARKGSGVAVQTGLRKQACDFWDSLP